MGKQVWESGDVWWECLLDTGVVSRAGASQEGRTILGQVWQGVMERHEEGASRERGGGLARRENKRIRG